MRIPFLFAAAAILAACAAPTPAPVPETTEIAVPAPPLASGLVLDGYDRSVRPQDDLHEFAGGKWLAETAIPADRSSWGTFAILDERAERQVREIAEQAAATPVHVPGSDLQKIGDLYASFMDEQAIEAAGLAPLEADFARIRALATHADVVRYIGESQRRLQRVPLGYYVGQDAGDATRYIGTVQQAGLSMPDRDYYLVQDKRQAENRKRHLAYVEQMLTMAGAKDTAARAQRIQQLETRIAAIQWSKVQNRDPRATYNRTSPIELAKLTPTFDWTVFFTAAGAPIEAVDINQPTYIEALAKLITATPLPQWREYFFFQLLDVSAPYLAAPFADAHFDFHSRALQGVQEQPERWKRAVSLVNANVGHLVGKEYVRLHFQPESKARMLQLVDNLRAAFDESIDTLEWMEPETRAAAKSKLARLSVKIGYPDVWQDYSPLSIVRGDLFGNMQRSAEYRFGRGIAKLGKPIDRTEWFMTPQTVNAYFSPMLNEIVFPAAILQPPFFDATADDAANYGGIGGVIGHEISHGFDDSGRQYDGNGNLRDWWTPADAARFKSLADRLVAQYDGHTVLDGQQLNGRLTLGENIGDLSGLAVAYRAYLRALDGKPAPVIDGFSGEQRFFLGWAQGWRTKYRDENLRMRLLTDLHSPARWRVNGVVVNIDEFHDAFGVDVGDGMYLAPEERVKIW
ncbi:MAG TPA: M13-type metalloendopeptidase [Steroidobacteraceae bacterium]|nr:M13-type metalloendopeptidase [Steroidobacteraceae bacterium]